MELFITRTKRKKQDRITYNISNPMFWSTDTPYLYNFNSQIIYDGKEEDSYDLSFEIRTISSDAQNGLLLNAKSIKLKGRVYLKTAL